MEDNIIIEDIEFKEELYRKNIEKEEIKISNIHGIGDEKNANKFFQKYIKNCKYINESLHKSFSYDFTAQRIFVEWALGLSIHSCLDGRITSFDTSLYSPIPAYHLNAFFTKRSSPE